MLENSTLDLSLAFNQTSALDLAQRNSQPYSATNTLLVSGVVAAVGTKRECSEERPTVLNPAKKKNANFVVAQLIIRKSVLLVASRVLIAEKILFKGFPI